MFLCHKLQWRYNFKRDYKSQGIIFRKKIKEDIFFLFITPLFMTVEIDFHKEGIFLSSINFSLSISLSTFHRSSVEKLKKKSHGVWIKFSWKIWGNCEWKPFDGIFSAHNSIVEWECVLEPQKPLFLRLTFSKRGDCINFLRAKGIPSVESWFLRCLTCLLRNNMREGWKEWDEIIKCWVHRCGDFFQHKSEYFSLSKPIFILPPHQCPLNFWVGQFHLRWISLKFCPHKKF